MSSDSKAGSLDYGCSRLHAALKMQILTSRWDSRFQEQAVALAATWRHVALQATTTTHQRNLANITPSLLPVSWITHPNDYTLHDSPIFSDIDTVAHSNTPSETRTR